MHVARPVRPIEHHADGVEETADQQQCKSVRRYQTPERLDHKQDRPAHEQVKDQGQPMPLFHAERIGGNAGGREEQVDGKKCPAGRAAQQRETYRRVAADDQDEYSAMIKLLEGGFCGIFIKGMIKRRHGEQGDQTETINGSADDFHRVAVFDCEHNNDSRAGYRKQRTDSMGNRVRDLLSLALIIEIGYIRHFLPSAIIWGCLLMKCNFPVFKHFSMPLYYL